MTRFHRIVNIFWQGDGKLQFFFIFSLCVLKIWDVEINKKDGFVFSLQRGLGLYNKIKDGVKSDEREGFIVKYDIIRLMSAELWNFKNVAHGKLEMPGAACRDFSGDRSEILGIYGQNGSGKTTVIDALYFAKQLLTGHALSSDAGDYIAKNAEEAVCALSFYLGSQDTGFAVSYEFTLRRASHGAYVARERLSRRKLSDGKLSPRSAYGL